MKVLHDYVIHRSLRIINAFGGECYQIERAERVTIGEEALYIWAILRSVTEATQ